MEALIPPARLAPTAISTRTKTRSAPGFDAKGQLLQQIDAYLRAKDTKVRQVSVSLACSWQQVETLRADGHFVRDVRPMARLSVSCRQAAATGGIRLVHARAGGKVLANSSPRKAGSTQPMRPLRQALVNLEAIPAPCGHIPTSCLPMAGRA
ncbi:hypothetical protein VXQ18_15145 [Brucella abortus]|nr:hypothetical protein [Brucella abortus]